MAKKSRTGSSTIYYLSKHICRIVGKFGVTAFTADTSPAFGAAVTALVAACQAFEALDDKPYEIDSTAPIVGNDLGLT